MIEHDGEFKICKIRWFISTVIGHASLMYGMDGNTCISDMLKQSSTCMPRIRASFLGVYLGALL